jgi:hypothetical protein
MGRRRPGGWEIQPWARKCWGLPQSAKGKGWPYLGPVEEEQPCWPLDARLWAPEPWEEKFLLFKATMAVPTWYSSPGTACPCHLPPGALFCAPPQLSPAPPPSFFTWLSDCYWLGYLPNQTLGAMNGSK